MLGSVVAIGIVGNPDNQGGQAGPFDPAFLIFAMPALIAALATGPWVTWRPSNLTRPRFVILSAAGTPFAWYGVGQALMQRNTWPPLADPHHQAHWYMMAVLAFMIVLVTAAAAISAAGWRLAALTPPLGAVAFGVVSLAAPTAASALTPLWASLAIAWGVIGLALTTMVWRSAARPA